MKKIILMALLALPMSLFAQKFAHVNSAESMQDELKTKAEDYEKNRATLLEPVQQRREQELNDLNQRMQQYYQTSQQDLAKAQQDEMQLISTKVMNAIKEVGVAGGYVYIMDSTAGIPYISETLSTDVTAQVKAKLGLK